MTLPADDTRQGLEEITTGLDRVRTSLAGFFTNGVQAVEEQSARAAAAEDRADKAERRGRHWKRVAEEIEQDRDRLAAEAEQWQATYGPNAILATCARMERAEARAEQAEADRDHEAATREQAQQEARKAAERARIATVAALNLRAQTPDRAQRTLDRIRSARTGADAWTELGMYYGMTPEQAGQNARRWRVTAVAIAYAAAEQAEQRAETASALGARYMGNAERFQAAWHSARLRAQREASHSRICRISRDGWRRRSREATQRAETVRLYVTNAYAEDIAPGVRDDIARILNGQATQYMTMEPQS